MVRMPFGGLEVFLAIAEHGSLRAAAAALGIRPPAVSQQLKGLEEQLGITLFARTTRSVELTAAGRVLLRQGLPAYAGLREALDAARGAGRSRKGTLRITLSPSAYHVAIAPGLAGFRVRYPEIEVELSLSEALVDIVGAGFHAGVRLGDLIEQDMIAVRLTPPVARACSAAPAYLAGRGRPRHPRDLLAHDCIRTRLVRGNRVADWRFHGPEGGFTVAVKGGLLLDSFDAVIEAVRQGLGIGWSLRPLLEPDLAAGRLESLLGAYAIEEPGFFLFFPKENARLEVLRVFIDYFKARAAAATVS